MTHKGKLALLKYWKNLWEHKFKRSTQTPCLSWASENTWDPWGKACDNWVYRSGACPAARVGTGLSPASVPPGRVGTGLTPSDHDLHLSVPWSKKAELHRSWHGVPSKNNAFVLAMLEACLIWSYQGGDADHPWDRPPEQFRWSTAFSVLITKAANAMRQASSLPVMRCKKNPKSNWRVSKQ